MKKFKSLYPVLVFVFMVLTAGCDKNETNTITVSPEQANFTGDGGSVKITINTDADSWSISNPISDWLNTSSNSGTGNSSSVTLNVTSRTLTARNGTLVIAAGNAKPVEVQVTQLSSDHLYKITANLSSINFNVAGETKALEINTDAPDWILTSDADWLQFSVITGSTGKTMINVTAVENTSNDPKTGTISISSANAATLQISVKQKGPIYPSYNTSPLEADATGMSSTAAELAAKIKLGWNIGNTLEAIGGETNWGNPKITDAYIKYVKATGFNAIRLPCSWNQYANQSNAQIQESWLNRVKEVVQYCVDNDMYVLLNIHWDGGWLENNCTADKKEANNAKQKAFWEQIATHLREFDEHLLFASANEPNVEDATQMSVLKSYHQTFINAVRATGGKNSYRILVVQGPSTDIQKTHDLMTTLPTDKVENRMMVEIHDYTPWNFTGMQQDETWGNMFYYWGKDFHSATDLAHNPTWGEEGTVDEQMAMLKTQFVDKGIPVIMGEYGCGIRTNLTGDALTLHKASRAFYFEYLTKQAKANGVLPFFWDTGGMLNRNNNTVLDQQGLDALIKGGE